MEPSFSEFFLNNEPGFFDTQIEELSRLQKQQLEQDDFFLAQQLQEAEYFQHQYFEQQAKILRSNPHEKVQLINFRHEMVAYHFQGLSNPGDYDDDDAELINARSYTFRQPQRSTNDLEEFPVLGRSPSRRPARPKPVKFEPAHQVSQREGIDYRSARLLTKMIGTGIIKDIQNLFAQNREAYLFHGNHRDAENGCIIKVFKASKSDLKKREIYIHGEWRFRYQDHHLNPKKMLKLWAEKEFRNLKRLSKANIPCTPPLALKGHILVLQYSGFDAQAPTLGKVIDSLSHSTRTDLYWEMIGLVKSFLIHAGLGPSTLLLSDGKLVFSDLGKAVTRDHPHATHFLRHDCLVMTKFFRDHGVDTLSTRQFYEFASQKEFGDSEYEITLDSQISKLKKDVVSQGEPTQQELIDEIIWFQLDLPNSLKDAWDPWEIPTGSVYQSALDSLNLTK